MDRDHDMAGRFTGHTGDDVLDALRAHHEPVATTSDLAATLDVTSEAVRYHLKDLHDAGRVQRKRAGASAVVWWPTAETDIDSMESEVGA